jgi:hypothetical protein
MLVDVTVRMEILPDQLKPPKVLEKDLIGCCRDAVSDAMCRSRLVCWLQLDGYNVEVKRVFVPPVLPNDSIPEIVHEGAD